MDLRQLKYFIQVVENGSLTKASGALHIAQPALSQQIAKLEGEIGKPLLVRSPKGVSPTDSGRALYNHARLMVRQFDQALSIARQETPDIQGMVSLGMPSTTLSALGLPLIRRVRQKCPQIILNIVEGMSGHLAQMMRLRQLDLAILFAHDSIPNTEPIPLINEELFVLAPHDNPWIDADQNDLTLEEVSLIPLILPTSSHGLRKRISIVFEQRGMPINVVAEIDSLSLLMDCVYEGLGATIKPMAAIHSQRERSGEWKAYRIKNANLSRRNYVYMLGTEIDSPSTHAVSEQIHQVTRELVESGEWKGVSMLNTYTPSRDQ